MRNILSESFDQNFIIRSKAVTRNGDLPCLFLSGFVPKELKNNYMEGLGSATIK